MLERTHVILLAQSLKLIGSPNQLAAITAGMTKQPASFVDPG